MAAVSIWVDCYWISLVIEHEVPQVIPRKYPPSLIYSVRTILKTECKIQNDFQSFLIFHFLANNFIFMNWSSIQFLQYCMNRAKNSLKNSITVQLSYEVKQVLELRKVKMEKRVGISNAIVSMRYSRDPTESYQ